MISLSMVIPAARQIGPRRVIMFRFPRTALRLLTGLLLVVALVGGLCWNSTRLNETERKLVGVWELVDSERRMAMVLLADQREFIAQQGHGKWTCQANSSGRWAASPDLWTLRSPRHVPASLSRAQWREYARVVWSDANRSTSQILRLTNDRVDLRFGTSDLWLHGSQIDLYSGPLRRSTDPELLRIFEKLSAGESP